LRQDIQPETTNGAALAALSTLGTVVLDAVALAMRSATNGAALEARGARFVRANAPLPLVRPIV
jgi:hypothetical protein